MALLCLSLAIGVTTAAFSIVHTAFLSPLPVPDGDRLVMVAQLAASPSVGRSIGS